MTQHCDGLVYRHLDESGYLDPSDEP